MPRKSRQGFLNVTWISYISSSYWIQLFEWSLKTLYIVPEIKSNPAVKKCFCISSLIICILHKMEQTQIYVNVISRVVFQRLYQTILSDFEVSAVAITTPTQQLLRFNNKVNILHWVERLLYYTACKTNYCKQPGQTVIADGKCIHLTRTLTCLTTRAI